MSDELDISGAVFRHRWAIGLITLACGILAGIAAFVAEPVYRAQVVFSITTDDDQSPLAQITRQIPIASLAGFLGNPRGRTRQEALTILRSREFTETFIRTHDLMPKLFPKQWDAERGQWKVSGDEQPTLWDAYRLFDRKIRTISEDRVSGIVTLSINWRDPMEAATWANQLVAEADARLRKLEIAEAERSIEFLRNEVEKTSIVGLQQAIYRLTEQQINRSMMARVRDDFRFHVLDPAAPPDVDDHAWPNRPALVVVGLLFGMLLGSAWAIVRDVQRRRREARVSSADSAPSVPQAG